MPCNHDTTLVKLETPLYKTPSLMYLLWTAGEGENPMLQIPNLYCNELNVSEGLRQNITERCPEEF